MLITFEWRRRKVIAGGTNGDNTGKVFLKQQMVCMPMIKLLMAVYTVTSAAPEIAIAVAAASETTRIYMPRIYYYGSVVKLLSSFAEIIALGFGSRQFRQCVKKMYQKK